jgi:hypothetical protein
MSGFKTLTCRIRDTALGGWHLGLTRQKDKRVGVRGALIRFDGLIRFDTLGNYSCRVLKRHRVGDRSN